MIDALLLTVAADGIPWWVTIAKDIGVPVVGAGLILYWAGTQLLGVLKGILAEMQANTKATVDFTASQREHTTTMVALKGEITAGLQALKGQVAEVERDVEVLAGPFREITGKHHIPPEFRAKKEGRLTMRAFVFYALTLALLIGFLTRRWARRIIDPLFQLRRASSTLKQGAQQLRVPNGHQPPRRLPEAHA